MVHAVLFRREVGLHDRPQSGRRTEPAVLTGEGPAQLVHSILVDAFFRGFPYDLKAARSLLNREQKLAPPQLTFFDVVLPGLAHLLQDPEGVHVHPEEDLRGQVGGLEDPLPVEVTSDFGPKNISMSFSSMGTLSSTTSNAKFAKSPCKNFRKALFVHTCAEKAFSLGPTHANRLKTT